MRTVHALFLLPFLLEGPAQAEKLRGSAQDFSIPNQYIVSLKVDAPTLTELQEVVQKEADRLTATYGATILYQYSASFPGVALKIQEENYEALAADDAIETIEADAIVRANEVQNNATFGIDRIDARTGLDGRYNFFRTGAGVTVFVIDTGLRATHVEFTGRVVGGFSAINDGRGTADCNGHGSHVAGTVAGSVFGVAKKASVAPVRVLDCNGAGSNSGVIAGIDFVTRTAKLPAVANMSLGGPASAAVDRAVNAGITKGVVFAVAAGNDNVDACNGSPARVPNAITVGASTNRDNRASFSNFGRCLDIFAPGQGIQSVGIGSNIATATLSGTSMASPHVAGAAALLLEGKPTATVKEVRDQMVADATQNVVKNIGANSPNRLLFTNPQPISVPTPPPPAEEETEN